MNKKSLIVVLIGFLLLVSNFGFILSAATPQTITSCGIVPVSSCKETILMYLSGTTNAHGKVAGIYNKGGMTGDAVAGN